MCQAGTVPNTGDIKKGKLGLHSLDHNLMREIISKQLYTNYIHIYNIYIVQTIDRAESRFLGEQKRLFCTIVANEYK